MAILLISAGLLLGGPSCAVTAFARIHPVANVRDALTGEPVAGVRVTGMAAARLSASRGARSTTPPQPGSARMFPA